MFHTLYCSAGVNSSSPTPKDASLMHVVHMAAEMAPIAKVSRDQRSGLLTFFELRQQMLAGYLCQS